MNTLQNYQEDNASPKQPVQHAPFQSGIPPINTTSQHATKENMGNTNKDKTEHTVRDITGQKPVPQKEKDNTMQQDTTLILEEQEIKRENDTNAQVNSTDSDSSVDEISRLKDELLRVHADMDNTKKRLTRLYEDRVRDKTVAILLDVIEHIDNFERAFDSQLQMSKEVKEKDNNDADMHAVFAGFGLIKQQLITTLQNNWGLNTIDALDKEFNPEEHEAIMQENSEQITYPTVVQEFMKGYTYLGKVIRPAKVKVALPQNINRKN